MSTPCYYCELDKPQACAVCIHGDADVEDLRNITIKVEALERQLKEANEREAKEYAELLGKYHEAKAQNVRAAIDAATKGEQSNG